MNGTPPTVLPSLSSAFAVKVCCPFTLTELMVGITTTLATVAEELLEVPPQEESTKVVPRAARSKTHTKLRDVDMDI
jgi:hypothetical protein